MRLAELKEEPSTGLYVCAKFTPETVEKLAAFAKPLGIPNALPASSYHTTIVYSKQPVFWRCMHDAGFPAKPVRWEVWSDHKTEKPVLVLHVESDFLRTRFDLAMDRGASYDFPDYQPHVSFSYDAEGIDPSTLPLPDFDLIIDKEIAQPLKP